MPYTVTPTALPEVLILEPKVIGDDRGFFVESFNQRDFQQVTVVDVNFVQDNHSKSRQGVLRGLHYQIQQPQGKLVRATHGAVFDVEVDLSSSSPNFGRWVGVELSANSKRQLWIPPDFSHGFLVLSDSADFLYKTTDYYAPDYERAIRWDDGQLAIAWHIQGLHIKVFCKDHQGCVLSHAELFG